MLQRRGRTRSRGCGREEMLVVLTLTLALILTRSRGCGREELLVVPIGAAGIRTTSPVTCLLFGARDLAHTYY